MFHHRAKGARGGLAPHLCATPCRRSCARAAGGAVISVGAPLISVHRASVPGTESSHKFTLFTPPACARRRNVHQSCRYSQVHTRRRSLARMSRPLMRAISADAMLRRAGAAVTRHPPPQKSANFCRLFGVWRRGGRRRAGNIPASDPDTARRPDNCIGVGALSRHGPTAGSWRFRL